MKAGQIREAEQAKKDLENECHRLKEDANLSKQRCVSLQRDFELQQKFMTKSNNETLSSADQVNYLKDRINSLEKELEQSIRDKTDY